MFCVYFCLGSVLTQKEGNRKLGKQAENKQVFWWLELLCLQVLREAGPWSQEWFRGVRTQSFDPLCKPAWGWETHRESSLKPGLNTPALS